MKALASGLAHQEAQAKQKNTSLRREAAREVFFVACYVKKCLLIQR